MRGKGATAHPDLRKGGGRPYHKGDLWTVLALLSLVAGIAGINDVTSPLVATAGVIGVPSLILAFWLRDAVASTRPWWFWAVILIVAALYLALGTFPVVFTE